MESEPTLTPSPLPMKLFHGFSRSRNCVMIFKQCRVLCYVIQHICTCLAVVTVPRSDSDTPTMSYPSWTSSVTTMVTTDDDDDLSDSSNSHTRFKEATLKRKASDFMVRFIPRSCITYGLTVLVFLLIAVVVVVTAAVAFVVLLLRAVFCHVVFRFVLPPSFFFLC